MALATRLANGPRKAEHLRVIRRSTAASAGPDVNEPWRKALLVCGILSSLLYGAMIWTIASEGYVGGLLMAYGSLGLLWPFASMHSREVLAAGDGTLGDTMHVVLAGATVLLMFVAMGFAAGAFGNASASTPSQASLFSSRLAR